MLLFVVVALGDLFAFAGLLLLCFIVVVLTGVCWFVGFAWADFLFWCILLLCVDYLDWLVGVFDCCCCG